MVTGVVQSGALFLRRRHVDVSPNGAVRYTTPGKGVQAGSGLKHEGLTVDQAIGAIAGHEGIHATDKAEINRDLQAEQRGRTYNAREDKPNQIEQRIIDQSRKLNE